MSDTVHHQADPPGVTWDVTIDGRRYLVIEEGPMTDCGYQGSRLYAYLKLHCRCETCRAHRSDWVQTRRKAKR